MEEVGKERSVEHDVVGGVENETGNEGKGIETQGERLGTSAVTARCVV